MNSQDLTTMKDIGKLIRDIRKQQGVTQEELAGISETGRRFISDVENGKNTTQTGKLLLVLKALGLNLYIFNKWEIYPMNFLCASLTLLCFTIAYCKVVSIRACPNSFCNCSIGIPLSIAIVANVRLNL